MIVSSVFTILFLVVATYVIRSGFFSPSKYDDINQKILTYLEKCDATSFEAVASPGYVKRLTSNGTLSLDICEKRKNYKCNSIVINKTIDNSLVNESYENERLYEEIHGNMYCTEKRLYLKVKINDKREVIDLQILDPNFSIEFNSKDK